MGGWVGGWVGGRTFTGLEPHDLLGRHAGVGAANVEVFGFLFGGEVGGWVIGR